MSFGDCYDPKQQGSATSSDSTNATPLAPAMCYAAGERVMAKHIRWGWISATVRWQSETSVSLETDHHYLITVPLEDVKRHN